MSERIPLNQAKKRAKCVSPTKDLPAKPESFLGIEMDATEYQQICGNLASFFDLLQKWSKKE